MTMTTIGWKVGVSGSSDSCYIIRKLYAWLQVETASGKTPSWSCGRIDDMQKLGVAGFIMSFRFQNDLNIHQKTRDTVKVCYFWSGWNFQLSHEIDNASNTDPFPRNVWFLLFQEISVFRRGVFRDRQYAAERITWRGGLINCSSESATEYLHVCQCIRTTLIDGRLSSAMNANLGNIIKL